MRIEILYIGGCPHFQSTVDAVKAILRENDLTVPVIETKVEGDDLAVSERFIGSPTVRINGHDIEPAARQRTGYGIMCRTYSGSGGVPSESLIRNAITEALDRSQ
jgi:hypothetical protein